MADRQRAGEFGDGKISEDARMDIPTAVQLPPGQRGEQLAAVYVNAYAVSWGHDGVLVRLMFGEGLPGSPPVPRVAVTMTRAIARQLALLMTSADEAEQDKGGGK